MIRFTAELADEYVLGLLEKDDELRLERLASTNEGVARAIAEARDRFLELDLQTQPLDMPDGLADRILARLGDADAEEDGQIEAAASDVDEAGSPAAPKSAPSRLLPAAIAAMLALVAGFGVGWQLTSPEPVVVAILLDDAGAPRAMVEDFGDDTARLRFLSSVEVPDDRVMQVWTLPSAELGPRSMGLLPEARVSSLAGFTLPEPRNDQLYEITLEPEGGSPTGLPTGPILAKGYAAIQTY